MDNLQEAYLSVYNEEVEQLDEITRSMGRRANEYNRKKEQDAHMERVRQHQERMENDPAYRQAHMDTLKTHNRGENQKESFDLFDYLLEYLVAEGYANTNENAIAIMANMSEDWRQSIVEQELTARQKYLMGKVEKMNKEKSGSAFKHVPGKQNVGGALDRANRSAMQMRGEK